MFNAHADMIERRLRAASDGRERRESETLYEAQAQREREELEQLVREANEMAELAFSSQQARRNGGVDRTKVGSVTPPYHTPREHPVGGAWRCGEGDATVVKQGKSTWDDLERDAEQQYRFPLISQLAQTQRHCSSSIGGQVGGGSGARALHLAEVRTCQP